MEVQVEINSRQIFEDGREEKENNKSFGKIEYHKNGTSLEFSEKYEEQELKFKISILKDKAIVCRNGQNMILDLKNKTIASLETPYGWIKMIVTTNNIDIVKEENDIKHIHFEYQIELENSMKYNNIVDVYVGK